MYLDLVGPTTSYGPDLPEILALHCVVNSDELMKAFVIGGEKGKRLFFKQMRIIKDCISAHEKSLHWHYIKILWKSY